MEQLSDYLQQGAFGLVCAGIAVIFAKRQMPGWTLISAGVVLFLIPVGLQYWGRPQVMVLVSATEKPVPMEMVQVENLDSIWRGRFLRRLAASAKDYAADFGKGDDFKNYPFVVPSAGVLHIPLEIVNTGRRPIEKFSMSLSVDRVGDGFWPLEISSDDFVCTKMNKKGNCTCTLDSLRPSSKSMKAEELTVSVKATKAAEKFSLLLLNTTISGENIESYFGFKAVIGVKP